MYNELDFRVGDVVCDLRFGTGKIEEIEIDSRWPIRVNLGGSPGMYLHDGRESHLDNLRSLYHGTWEQVFGNLPDLKPKRKVKRWVNLYGSGEFKIFNDEVTAKSFAETTPFKVVAVAVEVDVDE